jgi:hypothetical protein
VGAIVGSSLLTIAAFVMVLRYKRRRRNRQSLLAAGPKSINHPTSADVNGGNGGYEKISYGVDIKQPEPAVQTQRVGFAAVIGANRASFHLRTPPKGKYRVFPKSKGATVKDEEAGAVESPTSEYSVDNEKAKPQRGSKMESPPSLDKWLRVGTNVSPFGTLNAVAGGQQKKPVGSNWPLDGR